MGGDSWKKAFKWGYNEIWWIDIIVRYESLFPIFFLNIIFIYLAIYIMRLNYRDALLIKRDLSYYESSF